MHFSDLLASADIMLTKPGYGAFVEAACSGIPVLYVERDDWPEQPYLITWLSQHGLCHRLTAAQVQDGNFAQEVQHLLQQVRPTPIVPTGNTEAAGYIADCLCQS
jgi:UDP-N-acetylglucosamine:LPS N-acetylglucosamine transferase